MMVDKKSEVKSMEDTITSFIRLPVYTRNGLYVGSVKNVLIDVDEKKVSSLLLTKTNPSIVEGAIDVAVPYRWVNAVGDIVILSYFPDKVKLDMENSENPREPAGEEAEIENIDEPILRD